jgi:hypothetical protein
MTRWTKFRWWLARKLCPRITIVVCCGKTKRGVFYTTKQFVFKRQPRPKIALECEFKWDKGYKVQIDSMEALSYAEVQAVIDRISAPEGSEPEEMKEWREDPDFDPDFKPRPVPADILRDALKGTPLEGMDEKPT